MLCHLKVRCKRNYYEYSSPCSRYSSLPEILEKNECVDTEESATQQKFQSLGSFIPFLLPETLGSNWYHTNSQWNLPQISEDKLWTDKDSLITVQADLIIWPSPERPPIASPQTRTSDPMFLVHIIGTRDFSLNHYLLVISNSCSELPFQMSTVTLSFSFVVYISHTCQPSHTSSSFFFMFCPQYHSG